MNDKRNDWSLSIHPHPKFSKFCLTASNILYLISGMNSMMVGKFFYGGMDLTVFLMSTIYHASCEDKRLMRVDECMASTTSAHHMLSIIMVLLSDRYSFESIYQDCEIVFMFMITVVSMIVWCFARSAEKSADRSYVIYHSLWHFLSGSVMFLSSFQTPDIVMDALKS